MDRNISYYKTFRNPITFIFLQANTKHLFFCEKIYIGHELHIFLKYILLTVDSKFSLIRKITKFSNNSELTLESRNCCRQMNIFSKKILKNKVYLDQKLHIFFNTFFASSKAKKLFAYEKTKRTSFDFEHILQEIITSKQRIFEKKIKQKSLFES